ncbi:MAG: hypothetical protein RMJ19_03290 [Gemmatales bacterium]|nr:hypothetical protein [Gemmatales bacterium]MDW8174673.1 hypothetical protein [Gemmatales bacterium]
MAQVGIKITGDAVEFITAMKRVEGEVRAFHSSVSSMASSLASTVRSMMTGLVAGFAAVSIRGLANEIDEVAKTARVLGQSAGAFSAISYGAQLAGVSGETLRQSLVKLQALLGEASQGSHEAAGKLAALGLSAEQLSQLPLSEQLATIADAMQGLTEAEQIALAMELFGKSGHEMIRLLQAGGDAIRQMAKDGSTFSSVLGQIDTSAIEAMNDAISGVVDSVKALAAIMLATLAPAISQLASLFTGLAQFIAQNIGVIQTLIAIVAAAGAAYVTWRAVVLAAHGAMLAYRAALAAVAAVKAFLMVLTNPASLALVAVAGAAAIAVGSMLMFTDAAKEAANVPPPGQNWNTTALRQAIAGTTEEAKRAQQALEQLRQESARLHTQMLEARDVAAGELAPVVQRKQQAQKAEQLKKEELAKLHEQLPIIQQLEAQQPELERRLAEIKARIRELGGELVAPPELVNELSIVSGRAAQIQSTINQYREKEKTILNEIAAIQKELNADLRTIAETEAYKTIGKLREETQKLLGLDWSNYLERLSQAGAPQGVIEQLQKAKKERDIAQLTKDAREFAEQLARSAESAEAVALGISESELALRRLRERQQAIGGSAEFDKAFAQAEANLQRLQQANLLKGVKDTVDQLRQGLVSPFDEAARKAAELQIAVQAGLINAQEEGRLLQVLFAQTARRMESMTKMPSLLVQGSIEEARFLRQIEFRETSRNAVENLIREQINIQRQQLLAQHRIADRIERLPGAAVANP